MVMKDTDVYNVLRMCWIWFPFILSPFFCYLLLGVLLVFSASSQLFGFFLLCFLSPFLCISVCLFTHVD